MGQDWNSGLLLFPTKQWRLKDEHGLGLNWHRWQVLQEQLRMLAQTSQSAGPLSSLGGGLAVSWHLAPRLQQCTGLPMLGSDPSSWGCFLPAGHVLSFSICSALDFSRSCSAPLSGKRHVFRLWEGVQCSRGSEQVSILPIGAPEEERRMECSKKPKV